MHGSGGLEFNDCAHQRFSLHGVDLTKFDGGGARDKEVITSIPQRAACCRPVEYHKVNAELIFAAIHAKSFDSESDIQVQVRAWSFHFDCFFDSD